jgi:hypothetical protein
MARQPTPAITVHSLDHALAALAAAAAAAQPIDLMSAPDAGIYAGPGWFKALADMAREAVPDAQFTAILDCGDDTGAAQAAIRAGIEAIVFAGPPALAARLADIAAAVGCRVLTERPPALLDLLPLFFADRETLRRRCRDALASLPAFC